MLPCNSKTSSSVPDADCPPKVGAALPVGSAVALVNTAAAELTEVKTGTSDTDVVVVAMVVMGARADADVVVNALMIALDNDGRIVDATGATPISAALRPIAKRARTNFPTDAAI